MVPTWVRLVPATLGLVAIAMSVAPATPVPFPPPYQGFLATYGYPEGLRTVTRLDLDPFDNTGCVALASVLTLYATPVLESISLAFVEFPQAEPCGQVLGDLLFPSNPFVPALRDLFIVFQTAPVQDGGVADFWTPVGANNWCCFYTCQYFDNGQVKSWTNGASGENCYGD